jgi:hypothetical protein
VPPYFLIEGHLSVGLGTARKRLTELHRECTARGVRAEFDYVALDANGDQTGVELTVGGDKPVA